MVGNGGGPRISLTGSARKTAEYRVRQQVRQNEDERDQQNDLAQTGQQQADLGLTQRHKALLAGDLDTGGEDTRHIDAHGPGGVIDQGGIRGEDAGTAPGTSIISSQKMVV